MSLLKQARKRTFQESWEEKYFCCAQDDNVICLLCSIVQKDTHKWNIKRHYDTVLCSKSAADAANLSIFTLRHVHCGLRSATSFWGHIEYMIADACGRTLVLGQLRLCRRSVAESKIMRVMTEWGTQGEVQQISWHLSYDWGKSREISVRKPSGALSSVSSHCFKWGPFPPIEVRRVTLSTPIAKLGLARRACSKIWGLESDDPGTSGAPGWATIKKFSSSEHAYRICYLIVSTCDTPRKIRVVFPTLESFLGLLSLEPSLIRTTE